MAKRRTAKKEIPLQDRPIGEVWMEYKEVGSKTIRNFFVEKYLHLVKAGAERVHSRLPAEVEVDELKQEGVFGLMDAIDSFDLDRGVKFETFCAPRIRGAILDHLRASDWAPRLVRARTRTVGIARDQLRKKWGREPTEEEVAKHMGLSLAEYRKIAPDAVPTVVKPLQQTIRLNDSDRQMTEAEVVPDTRQLNPRSVLQKRDALDLLTRRLTRAERLIVVLYYYEELTMKEIGATLDLSESRVSQMHSSILARLRAQMQNRDSELCGEAA